MRFALEPDHWYGLTMFPGYTDTPFHSPLRVDSVQPLRNRHLKIEALFLAYAAGVRDRTMTLKILKRAEDHLVAEQADNPARTFVIAPLTGSWMKQHFPRLRTDGLFDSDGRPVGDALVRAAG